MTLSLSKLAAFRAWRKANALALRKKMEMLNLLDYLANWYLEWRLERKVKAAIKADPALARFERADITRDHTEVAWSGKAVALLADDAARYLEAHQATNYCEFEMIPRLASGVRPIRVTVAWSDGEMPAARAARLAEEVERLQVELKRIISENDADELLMWIEAELLLNLGCGPFWDIMHDVHIGEPLRDAIHKQMEKERQGTPNMLAAHQGQISKLR